MAVSIFLLLIGFALGGGCVALIRDWRGGH
jgi:hypothetical protein